MSLSVIQGGEPAEQMELFEFKAKVRRPAIKFGAVTAEARAGEQPFVPEQGDVYITAQTNVVERIVLEGPELTAIANTDPIHPPIILKWIRGEKVVWELPKEE